MQSISSSIWTRVAVSISYDENHYTTGTSLNTLLILHFKIELERIDHWKKERQKERKKQTNKQTNK